VYDKLTDSKILISELVHHVVNQWIETQPKGKVPSDSKLRKSMPVVFKTENLRAQFVKRLGHFWEQRMLRMLTRLGIRREDKKREYQIDAGGVKKEVNQTNECILFHKC
jgi:hypothetical protein